LFDEHGGAKGIGRRAVIDMAINRRGVLPFSIQSVASALSP
jgi:hypothetical protein